MGWLLSNIKLWLYGLGVAVLAIAVALIRKSGADAERLRQAQADAKAASTINQKRTEARQASDPELDARLGRWTREDEK